MNALHAMCYYALDRYRRGWGMVVWMSSTPDGCLAFVRDLETGDNYHVRRRDLKQYHMVSRAAREILNGKPPVVRGAR